MVHKSGFVNIIGNPNVGKSTLMNRMVGEKISIITSKAQTTRHRIMGIVGGDDFQIVYSDTPGIIRPHYKLHDKMLRYISLALDDADILLYITDIRENYGKNKDYIERIKKTEVPVILVVNKIDLVHEGELQPILFNWREILPKAHIIPVSALKGYYLPEVFDKIVELLPENPPYYPKDTLTDKPERFFVSEIIREKIFLSFEQEIPYSSEVQVESFKDEDQLLRISALIYVLRDSQKAILIGKKGAAIKKVGTEARKELEALYGKKVFLELHVKVHKDWRNKEGFLRTHGYNS